MWAKCQACVEDYAEVFGGGDRDEVAWTERDNWLTEVVFAGNGEDLAFFVRGSVREGHAVVPGPRADWDEEVGKGLLGSGHCWRGCPYCLVVGVGADVGAGVAQCVCSVDVEEE